MKRAAIIGLALLAACGQAEIAPTTEPAPSTTTSTSTTTTQPPVSYTVTTWTIPEKSFSEADVEIDLVVLESRCFGSAGGRVEFIPEVTLTKNPAPGQVLIIVYEVSGTEHGAQTFNVKLEGTSGSVQPERVSTASCEDELETEVVMVLQP